MPKAPTSAKGRKQKIITIAVVVLLLVLAAGVGVLVQWLQHKGNNSAGGKGANNSAIDSGIPQNSLPQSVQSAQNTAATGNYSDSNKQIASSLATTSNNDEKFELLLQQGVNDENQQKWSDAMNAYKQAESIKQTSDLYESMGRVAQAEGDKASALAYYKKALPLVPANDPLHDFYVNQLQSEISQVGG